MRVHSGVWSDRGSHECNARVPLEEEDAVRIHELPEDVLHHSTRKFRPMDWRVVALDVVVVVEVALALVMTG